MPAANFGGAAEDAHGRNAPRLACRATSEPCRFAEPELAKLRFGNICTSSKSGGLFDGTGYTRRMNDILGSDHVLERRGECYSVSQKKSVLQGRKRLLPFLYNIWISSEPPLTHGNTKRKGHKNKSGDRWIASSVTMSNHHRVPARTCIFI